MTNNNKKSFFEQMKEAYKNNVFTAVLFKPLIGTVSQLAGYAAAIYLYRHFFLKNKADYEP